MNTATSAGFVVLGLLTAFLISPALGLFLACLALLDDQARRFARLALFQTAGALSVIGIVIAGLMLVSMIEGV